MSDPGSRSGPNGWMKVIIVGAISAAVGGGGSIGVGAVRSPSSVEIREIVTDALAPLKVQVVANDTRIDKLEDTVGDREIDRSVTRLIEQMAAFNERVKSLEFWRLNFRAYSGSTPYNNAGPIP